MKIRKTNYRNAISVKFDNRRITAIDRIDSTYINFQIIDHEYTPKAHCELLRGKVASTTIRLSKEACAILYGILGEMLIKEDEKKLA